MAAPGPSCWAGAHAISRALPVCGPPDPGRLRCSRLVASSGGRLYRHLRTSGSRHICRPGAGATANAQARPDAEEGAHLRCERGFEFSDGSLFYRDESAVARDLAVLAASVVRKDTGRLRVLDLMTGCGVRRAAQLRADQRQGATDALGQVEGDGREGTSDESCNQTGSVQGVKLEGLQGLAWEPKASSHHWAGLGLPNGAVPWRVSHFDASRVLAHAFLSEDFMDVVDVDAFGLPGAVLTPAVGALRFGGLLTVAVSDGPACGGHRPAQCLAHLGAAVLPGPCGDELVLRALIARTVLAASQQGVRLEPAFSQYSSHGPVLRCTFQSRGREAVGAAEAIAYIAHDPASGDWAVVPIERLASAAALVGPEVDPDSVVVQGPLWVGPLHLRAFVARLAHEAVARGWANGASPPSRHQGAVGDSQGAAGGALQAGSTESRGPLPGPVMAAVKGAEEGDEDEVVDVSDIVEEFVALFDKVDGLAGEVARGGRGGDSAARVALPRDEAGSAGSDCEFPLPKRGRVREGQLASVLAAMDEEGDAALPPWYVPVADVARLGRLRETPSPASMVDALRLRGFAASLTQFSTEALKTDAPMAEIIATARKDLAVPLA